MTIRHTRERGGSPTAGCIAQHLLEEGTQGLLVGLLFRRHQLRGGLDPARTPEPDGGVADPKDLGQMPGPGSVSTL